MNVGMICRALAFVGVMLVLAAAGEASAEGEKHFVPQLSLSVLSPVKVAFHPKRDDLSWSSMATAESTCSTSPNPTVR